MSSGGGGGIGDVDDGEKRVLERGTGETKQNETTCIGILTDDMFMKLLRLLFSELTRRYWRRASPLRPHGRDADEEQCEYCLFEASCRVAESEKGKQTRAG